MSVPPHQEMQPPPHLNLKVLCKAQEPVPGSGRSQRLHTHVFLLQELYACAGRLPSALWDSSGLLPRPPLGAPGQLEQVALTGGSAWQNPGS